MNSAWIKNRANMLHSDPVSSQWRDRTLANQSNLARDFRQLTSLNFCSLATSY